MPGTDYTWTGDTDGDPTVQGNWNPTGVPGTNAADTITIDVTGEFVNALAGAGWTTTIAGATINNNNSSPTNLSGVTITGPVTLTAEWATTLGSCSGLVTVRDTGNMAAGTLIGGLVMGPGISTVDSGTISGGVVLSGTWYVHGGTFSGAVKVQANGTLDSAAAAVVLTSAVIVVESGTLKLEKGAQALTVPTGGLVHLGHPDAAVTADATLLSDITVKGDYISPGNPLSPP